MNSRLSWQESLTAAQTAQREKSLMKKCKNKLFRFLESQTRVSNTVIMLVLLFTATAVSFFFFTRTEAPSSSISLCYILALFLTARYTSGYFYGILSALVGVVCVNFLFTYPYFELNFTLSGYPITFIAMFTISIITSALTTNIKEQSRIISEREKMLMEAEKEKMRANLLRAISHDIRTPLTSIIGSSTVYLENEASLSDSDKRALVSHILEDSNWLLNMVENLLSVTRINNETAKVSTSLEPVEEVLGESISRLKKRLPDAQVKVSVPDEFLMIPMDAILIEQVLINLMENAIVHSKSTKPIECFVEAGVSCVTFHVRDYGIGIPPEKLKTIFDGSSSTTSTSTDGRKGMGIGLSICKTIITAHGGTLAAVNHADGAEFYFTLPKGEQNIGT